ncbi:unnamed protein product [marine sediment metagenome]|uniref:Uncharacterized protein n=1 Tax=marine sediment metagenome TaxID=412755 RepID=X1MS48_9ZZZZ
MAERLINRQLLTSAISLEMTLKEKGTFEILPSPTKDLARAVDRSSLSRNEKKAVFIYILWMDRADCERIGRQLKIEPKAIRRTIDWVLDHPSSKLERILDRLDAQYLSNPNVSLLTKPGARWGRRRPETIEFDQEVKRLREEGLNNSQIAERLGSTVRRIQLSVGRLLKNDEIESRKPRTTFAQRETLDSRVLELLTQNPKLLNREIEVAIPDVTHGQILASVQRLRKARKIERRSNHF